MSFDVSLLIFSYFKYDFLAREARKLYIRNHKCFICFVFDFIQMLPGASWLALDRYGFTYSLAYKKTTYLWNDVQNFRILKAGGVKSLFLI